MKVLFVGYDLDPSRAGRGGVAVYQSSLARTLRSLGDEVTLFLGSRHTVRRRPRLEWSRRDGLGFVELVDSPLRHCDHRADPLGKTQRDMLGLMGIGVDGHVRAVGFRGACGQNDEAIGVDSGLHLLLGHLGETHVHGSVFPCSLLRRV